MNLYEQFSTEITKIAAEGSLLTEKEEKKFQRQREGKDYLTRALMGGAGVSMASAAVPLTAKMMSPAPTLYHGTTLESADKIFNNPVARTDGGPEKGLLTRFAGRAGRLNEKMLAEAALRSAEKHGIKLTDEELVEFAVGTRLRLSEASEASRDPAGTAHRFVESLPSRIDSRKLVKYAPLDHELFQAREALNEALHVESPYESKAYNDFDSAGYSVRHYEREIASRGDDVPSWMKYSLEGVRRDQEAARQALGPAADLADKHQAIQQKYTAIRQQAADLQARVLKDPAALQAKVTDRMTKAPPYDAQEIVESSARELFAKKGMSPEQSAAVVKQLGTELEQSGKRIYFGWHPSTVAIWGRKGSEGVLFVKKMVADILRSPDAKVALEDLRKGLTGMVPPGFEVSAIPTERLLGADDLADLQPIVKDWLNLNLNGAFRQGVENMQREVGPDLTPARMEAAVDKAFGPMADRIRKAIKGAEDQTPEGIQKAMHGSLDATEIFKPALKKLTGAAKNVGIKTYLKMGGQSLLDTMTFGLVPEVKSWGPILKYKPETSRNVSAQEAGEYLRKLQGEKATKSIVLGVRTPAGAARWMTDFPGLSLAMSANPGLKYSVARFIPNFDPARDMSIASDVPLEHFKSVDVVDRVTGAVERLHITGSEAPKFGLGKYLRGAAAVLPQAAMGALGVDLAQAAIRGDRSVAVKALTGDLFDHKDKQLRPSEKNPQVKRWQLPFLSKVAVASYWEELEKLAWHPSTEAAWSVAKHTLPVAAGAAGLGLGAEALANKVMPVDKARDMSNVKKTGYFTARDAAMGLAIAPGALAVGALGAPKGAKASYESLRNMARLVRAQGDKEAMKAVETDMKALMADPSIMKHQAKFLGLAMLASMVAGTASRATSQTRRGAPPHAETMWNLPLSGKRGGEIVKKHPQAAAAIPTLAPALVPVAATLVARKYYPGHSMWLKSFLEPGSKLFKTQADIIGNTEKWLGKRGIPLSAKRKVMKDGWEIMSTFEPGRM